jgi:hypothetical protein
MVHSVHRGRCTRRQRQDNPISRDGDAAAKMRLRICLGPDCEQVHHQFDTAYLEWPSIAHFVVGTAAGEVVGGNPLLDDDRPPR